MKSSLMQWVQTEKQKNTSTCVFMCLVENEENVIYYVVIHANYAARVHERIFIETHIASLSHRLRNTWSTGQSQGLTI